MRNWQRHGLHMKFDNCNVGHGKPSDIDMMYIGRNGFLVLGEIKNEEGLLGDGQRSLLEQIADNHKQGAMVIYITHNKYVEKGDEEVDVAECFVEEYYYNGQWHQPQTFLTVREVIEWATFERG